MTATSSFELGDLALTMAGKPRTLPAVAPCRKRRRDDWEGGCSAFMIIVVRLCQGSNSRGNCHCRLPGGWALMFPGVIPMQLIGTFIVYSHMKLLCALLATSLFGGIVLGQGGPRPDDLGASPQPIGEAGVAWYTTWETALHEARRSNRPIFFMAAAATCSGISGVF